VAKKRSKCSFKKKKELNKISLRNGDCRAYKIELMQENVWASRCTRCTRTYSTLDINNVQR
jgi:hypothetical protein